MSYEVLEHTADLMVLAKGDDVEECFEGAALALFDQTVDLSSAVEAEEMVIDVEGDDDEELLYDMLAELLFLQTAEGWVLSRFEVRFTDTGLRCRAWGERYDEGRHEIRCEIKAVTFHELEVDRDDPHVKVLFDI